MTNNTSSSSFTQNGLKWGFSSNILYPSNAEERKIKTHDNCIYTTIKLTNTDLFDYKEKTSWSHQAGKPFRYVARVIYTQAVFALASPVGAVYHLSLMTYHSVNWLKLKAWDIASHKDSDGLKSKERIIKQYYNAFKIDAIASLCFYGGTVASFCLLRRWIDPNPIPFMLAPLNLLSILFPLKTMASLASTPEEKVAQAKAFEFKNTFGLVDKQGNILPFRPSSDDETWESKGLLWDVWANSCLELLQEVQQINTKLSRSSMDLIKTSDFPVAKDMIAHLKKLPNPEQFKDTIIRLTELDKRLSQTSQLLSDFINIRKESIVNLNSSYVAMPKFAWNSSYCQKWFKPLSFEIGLPRPKTQHSAANIEQNLDSTPLLTESIFKSKKIYNEYITFRNKVFRHATPEELFGLTKNPKMQDVNRAYRQWTIFFHPDKYSKITLTAKQLEEINYLRDQSHEARNALLPTIIWEDDPNWTK